MWKWNDLKRILFRKQSDTANLGAIMWPVAYPPDIANLYVPKQPHITVCIFDDINNPDLGYTLADVIDVVESTMWEILLWCEVSHLEWFGPEENVPVLRVKHDYLKKYHTDVLAALAAKGIPVNQNYPEYKPHVTIPDVAALDRVWPEYVMAGPVEVWWGDVHYKIGWP